MGEWVVGGTYVEVEPPSRLVFTFDWEHDDDPPDHGHRGDHAGGRADRLVLAHEETGDDGGHEEGWTCALVRLDQELS